MTLMSAESDDVRAVVLEEFVESNALLGIVSFTLRPVPGGRPPKMLSSHTKISLGDEVLTSGPTELDDQATTLLANVVMKDGQRLQREGNRSPLLLLIQRVWHWCRLLLKGVLGNRRQGGLPESEADWHRLQRDVTRFMQRGRPVEHPKGAGGEDV